eukprot:GHVU01232488.1.p1 GENE.GHVU01232488.1~~GHVU01232488.1.p1  ORF type:complete len:175 (-),score=22.95 GHVU01232488.1:921-1445(-)
MDSNRRQTDAADATVMEAEPFEFGRGDDGGGGAGAPLCVCGAPFCEPETIATSLAADTEPVAAAVSSTSATTTAASAAATTAPIGAGAPPRRCAGGEQCLCFYDFTSDAAFKPGLWSSRDEEFLRRFSRQWELCRAASPRSGPPGMTTVDATAPTIPRVVHQIWVGSREPPPHW